MSPTQKERAVVFGPNRSLSGIVTLPSGNDEAKKRVAAVILNAGVIHRVGPNRISVRLAREISKLGLTVMRFDLSGIGDSLPRREAGDLDDAVEQDINEAMSFLQSSQNIENFVFIGLCSGARQSLQTAYRDDRVVAALLIDPPAYRTKRSILTHYGKRALRTESWKNALSGKNKYSESIINYLEKSPSNENLSKKDERLLEWPSQKMMKDALQRLLKRETNLFFIYTGSMRDEYNYEDQLKDNFPEECASRHMRWKLMGEADHTFSTEFARQRLFDEVRSWFGSIKFSNRVG